MKDSGFLDFFYIFMSSLRGCLDVRFDSVMWFWTISCINIGLILDWCSGLSNLTTLSLKRNSKITTKGMSVLPGLVNLSKLDLERCTGIHGGLIHLNGTSTFRIHSIVIFSSLGDVWYNQTIMGISIFWQDLKSSRHLTLTVVTALRM